MLNGWVWWAKWARWALWGWATVFVFHMDFTGFLVIVETRKYVCSSIVAASESWMTTIFAIPWYTRIWMWNSQSPCDKFLSWALFMKYRIWDLCPIDINFGNRLYSKEKRRVWLAMMRRTISLWYRIGDLCWLSCYDITPCTLISSCTFIGIGMYVFTYIMQNQIWSMS